MSTETEVGVRVETRERIMVDGKPMIEIVGEGCCNVVEWHMLSQDGLRRLKLAVDHLLRHPSFRGIRTVSV